MEKQVGVPTALVEILDTTADNGDKLDDKTMILSAPVASAFTSRRAENEDFVEQKTAAPIQPKNSATDERCQLAGVIDQVPPIDLDNQARQEENKSVFVLIIFPLSTVVSDQAYFSKIK
jgi:hypothetical protein